MPVRLPSASLTVNPPLRQKIWWFEPGTISRAGSRMLPAGPGGTSGFCAEREAEPASFRPGIGRLVGDRPLEVQPRLAGVQRDAQLRGVADRVAGCGLEQRGGRDRVAAEFQARVAGRRRVVGAILGRRHPGFAHVFDRRGVLAGQIGVGEPQGLVRVESLVEVLPQGVGRLRIDQLPPGTLVADRLDAAAGRIERHAEQVVLDATGTAIDGYLSAARR